MVRRNVRAAPTDEEATLARDVAIAMGSPKNAKIRLGVTYKGKRRRSGRSVTFSRLVKKQKLRLQATKKARAKRSRDHVKIKAALRRSTIKMNRMLRTIEKECGQDDGYVITQPVWTQVRDDIKGVLSNVTKITVISEKRDIELARFLLKEKDDHHRIKALIEYKLEAPFSLGINQPGRTFLSSKVIQS